MGSHKGFIHKKLCVHYAWSFTHCPGKICNAQFFRARCILSQSALIRSPSCQRGIDLPPCGRFHGTDPSQGPARPTQCTCSKHKSSLTTAFGNIRAGQIVGKGELLQMKNDGYTPELTVCTDDMLPASLHLSRLIRLFFLESSSAR